MLKQFIPSEYCLKCNVCCRFGQKNSVYAPYFIPDGHISLKKYGNGYYCPHFKSQTNSCSIYKSRPLDCQLYPLMVTYDKDYENIILCVDTKCPYVQKIGAPAGLDVETQNFASLPHDFVMPFQPDAIKIATIKNLGGFKALALEHKAIFNKYLQNTEYSARSFVNIYIWSDLFNLLWKIIDDSLCVFYEYKNEFNMLLPILPKAKLSRATSILPNSREGRYGRVENIAEKEIETFKKLGLKIHKNTDEYIYLAKDIAELKGNKFASHRAAKNHFVKNNNFAYRPFQIDDIDECLALYSRWTEIKMGTGLKPVPIFRDSVYQQLMHESFSAQKKTMLNYEELGLTGRVVEINDKIQAYTFAFKMNPDTYCVIFETVDTNIKGLAQFMFSRLAQELCGLGARYINAMDDSGLENLKKTKLSWHPCKILTNYIAEI